MQTKMQEEKFIYSIIHKYFPNYENKEDLFQVGYIGFLKAKEKYQSNYGTKLSTYAYPFIYGEIRKYVREDKPLKISREISLLALKIEKASALLCQKIGRTPTVSELSYYLEIPEEKIIEAKNSYQAVSSLDERVNGEGKELTLQDFIADPKKMDLDTLITLKEELSKLSSEEKKLIEYRYIKDCTQSETAKYLGISQVQVSRNETKVLTKLRNRMN